jgi:CxxC motif-containing protein (DUF1111 family)
MSSSACGLGAVLFLFCCFVDLPGAPVKQTEALPKIDDENLRLFLQGTKEFARRHTVADGLGPYFNATSCAECHRHPSAGGSGDLAHAVALAGRESGGHFDPLAAQGGPFFQRHAIAGFQVKTIPESANVRAHRIPPNLFGAGLIEEIPDSAVLANARSKPNADGILGRPNMVNDHLGHFGYKAQVPSLFEFMFDAASNEMGLTTPFSLGGAVRHSYVPVSNVGGSAIYEMPARQVFNLMYFVKFLSPLEPTRNGPLESEGKAVFTSIGCAQCHVPAFKTGSSRIEALSNVDVPLYSDLLLHDLGPQLADHIADASASGQEFRTTPLWGLSRKKYFLHDGRAHSIREAILQHDGEAAKVAGRYRDLPQQPRRALAAFLGSL